MEREWLQAGYPFPIRHRKSCYSSGRSKTQAPTFLLFLDCVAQIHQQFPCSFEFSTSFLIMLFEHSYCSQFGKFVKMLDNSEHSVLLIPKSQSYTLKSSHMNLRTRMLNKIFHSGKRNNYYSWVISLYVEKQMDVHSKTITQCPAWAQSGKIGISNNTVTSLVQMGAKRFSKL